MNDLIVSAEELLVVLRTEGDKFVAGNKAAGTRTRKAAQDLKVVMQSIRNEVTSIKNAQ